MPDQLPAQTSQPDARADILAQVSPKLPTVSQTITDFDPGTYDARTLAELETIFGRSKLMDLLGRLKVEIGQRLRAPVTERDALGRDAHTLLSVSGSLGFADLSRRCTEMEQACLLGEDLAGPLDAVRQAAARAIAAIDDLNGGR